MSKPFLTTYSVSDGLLLAQLMHKTYTVKSKRIKTIYFFKHDSPFLGQSKLWHLFLQFIPRSIYGTWFMPTSKAGSSVVVFFPLSFFYFFLQPISRMWPNLTPANSLADLNTTLPQSLITPNCSCEFQLQSIVTHCYFLI